MNSQLDNFRQRVIHIVSCVPSGRVATYGDVAKMAGSPRAARQVGYILKGLPEGTALPWHRIINRLGEISLRDDGFSRQREALENEGIEVSATGKISLARYRWLP